MLGVVIASAERSRLYHRPGQSPCFPMAAGFKRPLQSVGYYLVDRHGVIRWASVGELFTDLPRPESLRALL